MLSCTAPLVASEEARRSAVRHTYTRRTSITKIRSLSKSFAIPAWRLRIRVFLPAAVLMRVKVH